MIIPCRVAVRKNAATGAPTVQKKNQRRMPFAKLSVVLKVFRLCQLSVREELMSERLLPLGMVPHLLSCETAATYWGISPSHFEEHVAPPAPTFAARLGRPSWAFTNR